MDDIDRIIVVYGHSDTDKLLFARRAAPTIALPGGYTDADRHDIYEQAVQALTEASINAEIISITDLALMDQSGIFAALDAIHAPRIESATDGMHRLLAAAEFEMPMAKATRPASKLFYDETPRSIKQTRRANRRKR